MSLVTPGIPVRTRIAPSPTGFFHVGGGRTALYNLFFARQNAGAFILRIEDTDAERHQEEAVVGIQRALQWLGVDWDEGPYRQSERLDRYREAADLLFNKGLAYWCDLTPDEIAERAKANGRQGYDGYSRDRGLTAAPGRVLRFRVPTGSTTVPDVVRDNPIFDNEHIEDFVIMRANGVALFILAVSVDDIDMRISHVIRGEEHLPNTPKQVMLTTALREVGFDAHLTPQIFGHLPVLVNEKRQKLSKRRDKVAMEEYQAAGILPEAMRNYLTLLGWSPKDDREILTMQESIDLFRLDEVKSAPAFFDVVKLASVNGQYIRMMEPEQFVARSAEFVPAPTGWDTIGVMAPLVQERVTTLSETTAMVDFFFVADDNVVVEPDALAKVAKLEAASQILADCVVAYQALESQGNWTVEALHDATVAIGETYGLKLGKAQAPIRVALTGKAVGPPLFESIAVIGCASTVVRLQNFAQRLSGGA
jgi:glutamyl-tRNA synthetase